ncbi:hypothetical protein NXS19_004597 [Fusarium pseudograminearum]|nr:hypothetical protein NXS19_004597 [Fusarium pseudograminearum]
MLRQISINTKWPLSAKELPSTSKWSIGAAKCNYTILAIVLLEKLPSVHAGTSQFNKRSVNIVPGVYNLDTGAQAYNMQAGDCFRANSLTCPHLPLDTGYGPTIEFIEDDRSWEVSTNGSTYTAEVVNDGINVKVPAVTQNWAGCAVTAQQFLRFTEMGFNERAAMVKYDFSNCNGITTTSCNCEYDITLPAAASPSSVSDHESTSDEGSHESSDNSTDGGSNTISKIEVPVKAMVLGLTLLIVLYLG